VDRLQKILAAAGVASRRKAEDLIAAGRVSVNGRVVKTLGAQADPVRDAIAVDGARVAVSPRRRYIKLHKPRGVLTTVADPQGRETVLHLLERPDGESPGRVFPIGRLDLESEGLLLLTDDGALAHRVAHPSVEIEKEYRAVVVGRVTQEALDRLRGGVVIEGRRTARAEVRIDTALPDGRTWLRFVLHEGRKRQIRRMCEKVGLDVQRLIRERVGPILLAGLAPGETRELDEGELQRLRQAIGLAQADGAPNAAGHAAQGDRDRRPERIGQKRAR
jgi:pseudouridine synthase